jgi:diguanylate cyclase (GGDEF)-like protein/PAS domain S-box-containing protein
MKQWFDGFDATSQSEKKRDQPRIMVGENKQASPVRILVVSDEPETNAKIRAALAGMQEFSIDWVRRQSEAVIRIHESAVDVVFVEFLGSDGDNPNSIRSLVASSPQTPVIILDNGKNDDLVAEAVRAGVRDVLPSDHIDSYSITQVVKRAVERQLVEDALFFEKERASVTLNSIGDAVLCTDLDGKVSYLNAVAESMTGWPRAEASGKTLAEVFRIIDGATRGLARDPMKLAVELNKTVGLTLNCLLVRRDGIEFAIEDSAAPIHDKTGRIVGAVIVFHDVSAARATARQITHSAQHDVLTNLPNRLLLNDRLVQSLSLAERQEHLLAVAFLDLDRFKYVNDSLGHAAGDLLLQSVAQRLQDGLRACDTISRQGGDEFVILLPGLACPEDAGAIARKLLGLLNAPHVIEGQTLHINGSIGISLYPSDGSDGETLIKNADMAMYCAKERGRNNFQFYLSAMNAKAVERQTLESALRFAIDRGEFFLNYQPKVCLKTGKTMGVEALLRWRRPDRGLVPPSQFVPVAEDAGLIVAIGQWALATACRQARAWQLEGMQFLPVSVNVSALEFRDIGFVEKVKAILSETGLPAQFLEMELTEGVLMEDPGPTVSALQELKRMGIRLAVDDFGTGHSSLSYLRQFPIDALKIDRSFVKQITAKTGDSKIISAIIGMAKSLEYLVVAEGIETCEQKSYLQDQGCAQGQGYLFSRPLSAAHFSNYVKGGAADHFIH